MRESVGKNRIAIANQLTTTSQVTRTTTMLTITMASSRRPLDMTNLISVIKTTTMEVVSRIMTLIIGFSEILKTLNFS